MSGIYRKQYLLFPIALIYWIVVYMRNKLFDLGILPSKEFKIPVLCVGNISVGGTGKTPHIEHLLKLLKDEFEIATLSRGYKRKSKGFKIAGDQPVVREFGDEPSQIKNKFPEVTVAVDGNRVRGIEKLIKHVDNLTAVLMDDGFQHRYVKPGLSILLIDYNRLITRDSILPVGRLREPAYEKQRAGIIIITKCPKDLKPIDQRIIHKEINPFPYQKLYFTTYKYGAPVSLKNDVDISSKNGLLENSTIVLVTGIANPSPLKEYLLSVTSNVVEMIYPDHHNFTIKNCSDIVEKFNKFGSIKKTIITTEKDATRFKAIQKLPDSIAENMYFIPIDIDFLFNRGEDFNQHIINYVRKNKKYCEISY